MVGSRPIVKVDSDPVVIEQHSTAKLSTLVLVLWYRTAVVTGVFDLSRHSICSSMMCRYCNEWSQVSSGLVKLILGYRLISARTYSTSSLLSSWKYRY